LAVRRSQLSSVALFPCGFSLCPFSSTVLLLFWFYNVFMANLMLVYGMRLLPSDEIAEIGEALIKLKNGREARVTMHVLEGGKEEIESQLRQSVDAFFSFYPEI
jgi:hypothetical protein